MFLGHFAMALAAKKAAPQASLGLYVLAAQWADALWPALLLTGSEQVKIAPGNAPVTPLDFVHYPISHSLATTIGWGVAFGAAVFAFTRNRAASLVSVFLVVSHWLLDWISHRPDLPIMPADTAKQGLGLWNSVPATMVVEFGFLGFGVWLYLSCTKPKDRVGIWGMWSFIAALALIYLANLTSPPPSVSAIAWAGMIGTVLIVAWTIWIDRHRAPSDPPVQVSA